LISSPMLVNKTQSVLVMRFAFCEMLGRLNTGCTPEPANHQAAIGLPVCWCDHDDRLNPDEDSNRPIWISNVP
jgi:hypothetical protein